VQPGSISSISLYTLSVQTLQNQSLSYAMANGQIPSLLTCPSRFLLSEAQPKNALINLPKTETIASTARSRNLSFLQFFHIFS
jgi:hypothetical protein